MTSKKKQNGEKSRIKTVPDEEAKRRGGDNRKATPVKTPRGGGSSSSKLKRGLRPRKEAQPLSPPPVPATAAGPSAEAQEAHSYKTPKRLSKRNLLLAAFNSPSSDAELQEEIFWDPQSPTSYALGNDKRKQAGKNCTVEISEIVNRIPPQDKNQTNSEVAHLRTWIGEDAIPCTPSIVKVRGRTKLSDTKLKLKNGEEELMQFVKQFNRNMVDAVQHQDIEDHTLISEMKTLNNDIHEDAHIQEFHAFVDDIPEADIALSLKPIKHSSGIPQLEPNEKSSQKSIDQEAEVAFNAIFDCSTQKLSGRLSQSMLDASVNSSHEKKFAQREKSQYVSKQTKTEEQCISIDMCHKQKSLLSFPSLIQIETPKNEKALFTSKENTTSKAGIIESSIQNTVPSKKDELDEWGSKDEDLLKDDSFIMQITQNPELISTSLDLPLLKPSRSLLASKENSKIKAKTNESSSWIAGETLLTPLNHLQFVPSKANEGLNNVSKPFSNSIDGIDKLNIKGSPLKNESTFKAVKILCDKSTANKVSSTVSQISINPAVKSAKIDNLLECSVNLGISEKGSSLVSKSYYSNASQSGKCNNNIHTGFQQLSSNYSTNKESFGPGILAVQTNTGKQNQSETITQNPAPLDDWNDPKFSEEILNKFCEFDNVWETNEKDDDDLLYQVCDDIEKITQTQDVMQGNKTTNAFIEQVLVSCNSYPSMGVAINKPGQIYQTMQLKHGSHSVSSLDNSFSKSNTLINNKTVKETEVKPGKSPVRPANPMGVTEHSLAMNKSLNSQNSNPSVLRNKVNKGPVKLNRFHSAEHFASENCSLSYSHDKSISQNTARPLANKVSLLPSKFTFTKTKSSLLTAVRTDHGSTFSKCTFQTEPNLNLGKGQCQSTIPLYQTVQSSQNSSLKRHHCEPSIQSTKEQKSQKCSQEEIERKKQEALARRKMRMQTLLKDSSPT